MTADLTFTGERFLPGCTGEIAYEHWHRYAFARRFARDRRVLDVACGEGYGCALLGAVAASVVGIDIDVATIRQARSTYGEGKRLRFIAASATGLPLADASFDVVVSFETIEHLDAAQQPAMLAEFARVLAPGGVLVISSPNKRLYSDVRSYVNPFHLHELYRDDLTRLLGKRFPAQRWYHQQLACWSGIWAEPAAGKEKARGGAALEAWVGDAARVEAYSEPEGMYFIVVAACAPDALPSEDASVSLFTDAADSERQRAEANAREVLRLDALLTENTDGLGRQTEHIHHLERLVAERERLVVERDAELARQADQIQRLEILVAEQERRMVVERDAAHARQNEQTHRLEKLVAEHDRQLEQANAARAQSEVELKRSAEEIADLRRRSAVLEDEKTRLEGALAAQERAIAYLHSFRGWLSWPSRLLRQRSR